MTEEEKVKNREYQRKWAAEWRKNNPEKYAQIRMRYQEKHREEVAARTKRYREKNPEKTARAVKKWVQENPDKKRIHNQNRDRRIKDRGGKLSLNLVDRLLKLQRGMCTCCKKSLKTITPHMDHIIPLAKGGQHVDSNIQLLCQKCNCEKHSKDPVDFMQARGYLI